MWVSNLFLILRLLQYPKCPKLDHMFYKCNSEYDLQKKLMFPTKTHNNVVSFESWDNTYVIFYISVSIQFPNALKNKFIDLKNKFIDLTSFTVCHWPRIKEHKCCTM